MSFSVRLAQEAKNNIGAIGRYIAEDSPVNAQRWRKRVRERLRGLKNYPERHEVAYHADVVGRDVRHTFFGVYRILYVIDGDLVIVLTVRHGARRPLTPDEVRRLG